MNEKTKTLLKDIIIEMSFRAMGRQIKDDLAERARALIEGKEDGESKRLGGMLRLPGKCQKCRASDLA